MSLVIKQTIRRNCQTTRAALTRQEQCLASQRVCEQIQALTLYQNAQHVVFYHAVRGEINLRALWEHALAAGKACYLPTVHANHTLSFLPFTLNTPWKINPYGIPEPDVHPTCAIPVDKLELIILPLVAFDAHGTRLGYGGGFYDRTFANMPNACLLGAAYAFQQQPLIPTEPWDAPLSGVVTELGVQWFRPLSFS